MLDKISEKVPLGGRVCSRGAFLRGAAFACAACAMSAFAGCSGASGGTSSSAGARLQTIAQSSSASEQGGQLSRTLFAFDTVVTLTASCSEEALDSAVEMCERFESLFSRTRESSDIGRINAAAGNPVQVAPETADIIVKALKYCEESGGLFDITIGAASELWDFKEGIVPDQALLEEAVKHIDYTNVQVNGAIVTLRDPKAKLDLGGIAKGYIADRLCSYLIQEGCESGFVNLGGNVKTIGSKPDGSAWHVGIQDPNSVEGAVIAAVDSRGESCVTSGLYERQFTAGNRSYWRILSPETGFPVDTDLISASLISSVSLDGDGYTKPLFMMGREAAMSWINAKEGIEGLLVGKDGVITQSDNCRAELR